MNGLALCAGVGGIELGLKIACPGYRTVCYCERETYAAATLVARMEDKALDEAPIWDDITTFDGKPWSGKVDIVTAGLPCQPYSCAGKRNGHEDERGWNVVEHAARIIGECSPSMAFFENVPTWVTSGYFRRFGDELCRLGYSLAESVFVQAKDVGAPHKRERVFVLAYREKQRERKSNDKECSQSRSYAWEDTIGRGDRPNEELGAPKSERFKQIRPESWKMAQLQKPGIGLFPPEPGEDWSGIEPDLKPAIRRMGDGPPNWVDRLRCAGNGVVPLAVAYAFGLLVDEIGETHGRCIRD